MHGWVDVAESRYGEILADANDPCERRIVYATRDAAPSDALKHDAWKESFAERHEFDVYPDHFMTGLRNEFAAGWHAAIKAIALREKT
jgi:hypothetical protein